MAKYGVPYYGGAKYGGTPKLAYSVEPVQITVLSFSKVDIAWEQPRGAFTQIRLVRNQDGVPETPDDGLTLWHEFATESTVSRTSFIDGEDNPGQTPLLPGKEVFYSVFLYTTGGIWVNAGGAVDVVPSSHGMTTKLVNTLPRVFTSDEQSPLSEASTTSALVRFLDGIAFTLEESLTYIDLLRPRSVNTPAPLLTVASQHVGLTPEPNLATVLQKRLIREAIYMYSRKGTALGIGTYCESLTGFSPTLTVTPNLMLTAQDATFYKSTGNWTATGGATLTSATDMIPDASVTTAFDTVYTGKIVAPATGEISVGSVTPTLQGVPVQPSTEYTTSIRFKCPASSGNITLSVKYYTLTGTYISTSTGTPVAANNTWQGTSVTATTPATAAYASIHVAWSAAGTYYVDMVSIQAGTSSTYTEARALDVYLAPARTNFIKNPSFELGTAQWTLSGTASISTTTDVSDIAYSGANSAQVVATGPWTLTSNTFPISVGAYYTASGLVKSTSDLTVSFIGRDSGGTITESSDVYPLGTIADWARFSAVEITDALTHSNVATYEVVFSGGAGTFHFDCIQAENSFQATEYFDGSMPSNYGVEWVGTAHESYSALYPESTVKFPRLQNTLNDWVPANTFWSVTTASGLKYTCLDV